MIGIDTNVLVRYLTLDDPEQVQRVDRLVDHAERLEEALHIDAIVLCEVVWVLRSVYRLSRESIADALEKVIDARQFSIEDRDAVRRALESYRRRAGDFADYLIGERNRRRGCDTTRTFDTRLVGSELFEAV